MRNNQRILSRTTIFFGITTIFVAILYLLDYVNSSMIALLSGTTQILAGLTCIVREQQKIIQDNSKGNERVWVFIIIAGMVVIINAIIKEVIQ
jgi:hypothetical protein